MKQLLLVVAVALTAVGAARADTFVVAPSPAAPAAVSSLGSGQLTGGATEPSMSDLRALWVGAGATYGIPWQVLAAINKIESNFGRNMGPSSAGAIGWMQFMPSTWSQWGTDADGDGTADPWNAADAIYSAGRYLEAAGGRTDLRRAVFAYNHADWYVNQVLALASLYAAGGTDVVFTLDRLQIAVDSAREQVANTNSTVDAATAAAQALARRENRMLRRADAAPLLSDALELRKQAFQIGSRRAAAEGRVLRLRNALARARRTLDAARDRSQPASFTPSAALLLSAPARSGRYVFPVGGGPETVSVSHYHHDYPAADIAAPEGAPVYAMTDAVVVRSWTDPNANNCGIGATITTTDGHTWTYCHLSYLDSGVTAGARLPAGASIGLVGHTGHATGPHLHLQLDPTNAYPQDEPWFRALAGSAFRWQDTAPPDRSFAPVAVPSAPIFALVSPPVVRFSQDITYFTR